MTQVSLYLFLPSRANLKLSDIHVSPKLVKKVITNLDLPNASGADCIPVTVLKNVNYSDVDLKIDQAEL